MQKNNSRVTNAWCMYDWANSVFPLTITSAIFPIYWNSQLSNGYSIWGMQISSSSLFSYCLSFAFLVIAFINPILSGISDTSGNKKRFMTGFILIGSIACLGMYFFDSEHVWIGILTFILGTIGYAGSLVFYNAFLPEIATEDRFDRLSARGFAMGYLGATILLLINLLFILKPDWFFNVEGYATDLISGGITTEKNLAMEASLKHFSLLSTKFAFVLVGLWWMGFSLIPLTVLKESGSVKSGSFSLARGYREINLVFKQLRGNSKIQWFLTAFFFYSMGTQTVMYVAALFGDKELQLPKENLVITILLIQLIAIPGAFGFAKLSQRIGNFYALMASVVVWIGVCVGAYFVHGLYSFYVLATVVGIIMGGIQALSRSTYAKLIPETRDTASYFSFFEWTEKTAIVAGTFSFGFIEQITSVNGVSNMRNSILALIAFFIISLLLLFRIRKQSTI